MMKTLKFTRMAAFIMLCGALIGMASCDDDEVELP